MARRRPNFYEHLRMPSTPTYSARFTYTFYLGAISIALFFILGLTGILEMFLYVPTPEQANNSVKLIAFAAPYGWLIRNMHYWAGQAMVVTVTLHMIRVLLSGGYKKRRSNWLIGMSLLLMTLMIDFTGFVLRWDDRASWALLVGTNLIREISPERTPDPRIAQGEDIFYNGTDVAPACALCHTLDGTTLVGPTLQGIRETASKRVRRQSARDYIRTSIISPNSYKPPGFENGSMYPDYGRVLTDEQIDALIAFLMTQ
ncbi:MAG TPA: c-type cytochrome [Chloroflexi bacterium]|nr:c-type cytochrome [Chloroflexota bacterium]